jgi:hypothetical protein
MKNRFSQQPKAGLRLSLIVSTGLLVMAFIYFLLMPPPPSNDGPGYILSGSSTVLNPDGGDYMSSLPGDGEWTLLNNEYPQFEVLAGTGGSNQPWQTLPNYGTEPTGSQLSSDIQSGGGCGNIDITSDSDGGYDYAYYSVIDPDGVSGSGDELLALAVRLANEVKGAFSFSFLMDVANDCGYDANATCGNPCFEYEIQITSQRNEVNVINIDGCSGSADCDALNPLTDGAYLCQPCNREALQVKAGSGACVDNPRTAVLWMAYVPFSQLPLASPDDDFRLVPATTTSPNSVIYKNTNVADFGGVGDPNDPSDCDCATQCAGQSCDDCIRDCALACASTRNRVASSFPVEWLEFAGQLQADGVHLRWTTAQEVNNAYFEVEQLDAQGHPTTLGQIEGSGNSQQPQRYTFTAPQPHADRGIYRIKQVDFDGGFTFSSRLEVSVRQATALRLQVVAAQAQQPLQVRMDAPANQTLRLQISSLNGQQVYDGQEALTAGQQIITLSQVQLSPGLYVIVAHDQNSGQQWSEKFKVQ